MQVKLFRLFAIAGAATAILFGTATRASATFTFTTNFTDTEYGAKGDIFLDSVVLDSTQELVEDFSFVNGAYIVANDEYTGGNSGAASADIGDNATTGTKMEAATVDAIVANLGNNNLNNIIDTEDSGSFQIDLSFEYNIDNLLIWERGNDNDTWGAGNSDLAVQAVDAEGNLLGNYLKITRDQWKNAGYSINTQEIGNTQEVGSLGVNILEDLGVAGGVNRVRFFSESSFRGPDWKFVGTDATRLEEETQAVPEPGALVGLGAVAGIVLLSKRATRQFS
jgi:hypothetical protein